MKTCRDHSPHSGLGRGSISSSTFSWCWHIHRRRSRILQSQWPPEDLLRPPHTSSHLKTSSELNTSSDLLTPEHLFTPEHLLRPPHTWTPPHTSAQVSLRLRCSCEESWKGEGFLLTSVFVTWETAKECSRDKMSHFNRISQMFPD